MADFSALKAAIQAVIKQNGNQEITGPILQEVLLSMVNTMGDGAINSLASALSTETTNRQNADGTLQTNINNEATARQNADSGLQTAINSINTRLEEGYVYVGIATVATNPGTPAGKVFYIALQAGTYTNFSSLAVTQGISILKYNGTAWSQDQLVGIDDVPTKESNKLVKSGGVFANIGAFDISEYHKSGNTLATYADLTAALAALPSDFQKGGISVKYVQTSDNKYVQFRLLANAFTSDVTKWQGIDDVPTDGSKNLIESEGVFAPVNALRNAVLPIRGNISIIGDSISSYAGTVPTGYATYYPSSARGVNSVHDMWWDLIISETNSQLDVNASWSGSRVVKYDQNVPDFYERTNILGAPNWIFVAMGTNDWSQASTLGDYDFTSPISSLSETEFIPAYTKGIKSLMANYPNAKILVFINWMSDTYAEPIKTICDYYKITWFDVRAYHTDSNNHPNKEGMITIAQTVNYHYIRHEIDNSPAYLSANPVSSDGILRSAKDTFPFSAYLRKGAFINTTQGKWGLNENVIYAIYPLYGSGTVKFKPHSTNASIVYLLEDFSKIPSNGEVVQGVEVTSNTEVQFTATYKYLYVLIYNNTDRTPNYILVNGINILKSLVENIKDGTFDPVNEDSINTDKLKNNSVTADKMSNQAAEFSKRTVVGGEVFINLANGSVIQFNSSAKKMILPKKAYIIIGRKALPVSPTSQDNEISLSSYNRGVVVLTYVPTDSSVSPSNISVLSANTYSATALGENQVVLAVYSEYGAKVEYCAGRYEIDGEDMGIEVYSHLGIMYCSSINDIPMQFDSVNRTCTIMGGIRIFDGTAFNTPANNLNPVTLDLTKDYNGDDVNHGGVICLDKSTLNYKIVAHTNAVKLNYIVLASYFGLGKSYSATNKQYVMISSQNQYSLDGKRNGAIINYKLSGIGETKPDTIDIISPEYDIFDLPSNINVWSDIITLDINGVKEMWLFRGSQDEYNNDGTGVILRVRMSDWTYIGAMYHNFGHVNTVDYNSELDAIMIGNLPSHYRIVDDMSKAYITDNYPFKYVGETTGEFTHDHFYLVGGTAQSKTYTDVTNDYDWSYKDAIYILYNVSEWVNKTPVTNQWVTDKIFLDFIETNTSSATYVYKSIINITEEKFLDGVSACWGESSFGLPNIVYVLAAGGYMKIALPMQNLDNSNPVKYVGTYNVLNGPLDAELVYEDDGNAYVIQGNCFYKGKVLTANGHTQTRAFIWTLRQNVPIPLNTNPVYSIEKSMISINPCDANGDAVDYVSEGICVVDGYVYQGCYGLKKVIRYKL